MSSKPRFVGKRVKLGDVCTIVSGATPKTKTNEYWGGEIRWVTPAELDGDSHYISDTEKHLTEAGYKSASLRMMPKGTVLLTTRAPIGKVAIAAEEMSCNQGFKNLVCSSAINNEFLYLYLKSRTAELQAMGRGATFKELSKKNVAGFEINLPAIDRQLDAVAKLTAVRSQIALAKQQHDQLDSLVKSRFVEMFEESDRYNGSVYRLADIGEIASGITKGRKARDKELFETPYLSTANVQAGRLDLSVIKTIDATMPEIEKFRLAEGDVLMTEGGDPDKVGRGAVAHNLPKNCIHQNHVFRVRLNRVILYPEYFEMFLQSPGCREYFFRASKQTTGIATINKTQLRNMQVLVPPIKAQEEFLAFASQVDKSRFIAQQQIEKLQMLYDSLAQDYFGD